MKYRELIQFDPITEVVQFGRLDEEDYRQSLVRNFVFSKAYESAIIPKLCGNLDYTASYSTFGLQVVGNYGTGKSHLMSLVSLIAENKDYLPFVQNESAKKVLGNIAGKYKVIRFELGSDEELWTLVSYQVDARLKEWGINYSLAEDNTPDMYADKLSRLMAHFEEKFKDKGLMIVIDEMLSYLKGRGDSARLNRDLQVLQALGQASDHSKFRMIFGVQELIYKAPEFSHAAKMLQKVDDRYRTIEITKQDVQFVVQCRLLHKNDDQKATIRQHLAKFESFFTDMHANMDEYVNLFPVNPSYFDNFQQIRVGKSQREVLKTLSHKFENILNDDIPTTEPGLICYDSYWEELSSASMQTDPDVRRVTEIMNIVHQKIDENFVGGRARKTVLAHRIANACAIKILQDSLEKTNGVNAEKLVDDLCYLDSACLDREFLIDTVNTTAGQIVNATVGQYFEQNSTNQEYHLRVEGGVNYEQKIKDFVLTMSPDQKDAHFFNFLVEFLPIEVEQYRREFKIFSHKIDWKSHKTMLDGYIFMGNPNERSTTHPEQNFYIYFMPIFDTSKMAHGTEPDSIYIHLDKMSDEMKDLLTLYAASDALFNSVDSSQKQFYKQFKTTYESRLKPVFQRDFMNCMEVVYQGQVQTINPQMMAAASKEQIVSNIASTLLEDYFCQKLPDYPKFTLLRAPLTSDNRAAIIKGAKSKIANPTAPNRDGEAILAGLGLLQDNQLSVEASPYALSIRQMLDNKGEGQVLNRDEILYQFFQDDWKTRDFNIDADFEFLVLATMVACAEIEIDMPGGKNINAANLKELVELAPDAAFNFSYVRRPRNINTKAVRELFICLTGIDQTQQLTNPDIYPGLVSEANKLAANAVKLRNDIANGIYLENIEILSAFEASVICEALKKVTEMCDKVATYASPAKMRNLPWTQEVIHDTLEARFKIKELRKTLQFVEDFRARLSYLSQAKQYISKDDLRNRIDTAMAKITEIVPQMQNETTVNNYKAELEALSVEYADWYLSEYNRLHITGLQETEKNKILNSNPKKICEAVFQADDKGYFAIKSQYNGWCQRMSELTTGATNLTRDAILHTPYMGFNPMMYVGKNLPTLESLKEEIENICSSVSDTLQQMFKDESLIANIDSVLDDSEKGLANRYRTGAEELSAMNAGRLVDIVEKLHVGIHKVQITTSDIRTIFNRPMTPEDAIKAFRQYINSLTVGSNTENIRIILQ